MRRITFFLALLVAGLFGVPVSKGQAPALDGTTRTAVIDGVLARLNESYVFPEVAAAMERDVRSRLAEGEYEAIQDGPSLALKLTDDLRSVSHDLHIAVSYSPEVLPPDPKQSMLLTQEPPAEMRGMLALNNFGFTKVEILPGNVGYIKLDFFTPPEFAADTYTAVMGYVANTDALIIDLRENPGSISPDAVPLFSSYFFEEPVHLNDIYWRPEDTTREFWTQAEVPGKRYLDKPVYLLTSRRTFSGAEEFAYDFQNLKRATVVGDTTGGGANPGGTRRVDDHFSVWVPMGRAINPITQTNWEGVGVRPDIPVHTSKALLTAHTEALKQLIEQAGNPGWKEMQARALGDVERRLSRFKPVTFALQGHPDAKSVMVAGSFNGWSDRSDVLVRQGDSWVGTVELEPGRYAYKFVVDGQWMLDPANPKSEQDGPYENSVLGVD